jgi:hypothetical protein
MAEKESCNIPKTQRPVNALISTEVESGKKVK